MNRWIPTSLISLMMLTSAFFIVPSVANNAAADHGRGFGYSEDAGNPLLACGSFGDWDDHFIQSHCVLADSTDFKMYYTGWRYPMYNGYNGIGMANSSDGKTWTKYASNPMLEVGPPYTFDNYYLGGAWVIKDGNTYKMWYHGYDGSHWRIGYATSNDGLIWTKYTGNPVFNLGNYGAWDHVNVEWPSVIKDGDTYKMWYSGNDGNTNHIGYATSLDGIAWTRYASNPVFDMNWSWDLVVDSPCVLKVGSLYKMWYSGYDSNNYQIGYAYSNDSVTWTRYAGNPVLSGQAGTWDSHDVCLPSVIFNGTAYKMWFTGVDGSAKYQIGYAIGNILPNPPTLTNMSQNEWINVNKPALKWKFNDPNINDNQTAYELQIAKDTDFNSLLVSTGKMSSPALNFVPLNPLPDGITYWRVRTWDDCDENSTWSNVSILRIDTTPPLNPSNMTSISHQINKWSSNDTAYIAWDIPTDGDPLSGYEGFSAVWDQSPTTLPDTTLDFDSSATNATSPVLPDCAYNYFHIRAKDRANNWAADASHFGPIWIDTKHPSNPTVESTSHIPGEWSNDSTIDVKVSGIVGTSSGVAGFACIWDNHDNTIPDGIINGSAQMESTTSPALSDGNNWYFHIRTENNAGTWSNDTVHLGPFKIDTTPPKIFALKIDQDSNFTTDYGIDVDIVGMDSMPGSGLSDMRFSLDGENWSGWEPYNNPKTLELAGPQGNRTVYAQLRDTVGNEGPVVSASIMLDTLSPEIDELTIDGGADYTNSSEVSVSVVAGDFIPGSGINVMAISFDNQSWGPWEPFCTTKDLILPPGDGIKAVYVKARDLAGNIGRAAGREIILDTTAPSSLSIVIANGANITNTSSVALQLNATDPIPGSGVSEMSFSTDGVRWTDWEPFANNRAYKFPQSDGIVDLQFRVRDKTFNVATPVCATILIDVSIPKILMANLTVIDQQTVNLQITANELVVVKVIYGLISNYSQTKTVEEYNINHNITITGLQPGTQYYYKIYLTDRGGTQSASQKEMNFTTMKPDNKAPEKATTNQAPIYYYTGLIIGLVIIATLILILRKGRKKGS